MKSNSAYNRAQAIKNLAHFFFYADCRERFVDSGYFSIIIRQKKRGEV
jgi:hypothetical protein